jgi:hypothetical protein
MAPDARLARCDGGQSAHTGDQRTEKHRDG